MSNSNKKFGGSSSSSSSSDNQDQQQQAPRSISFRRPETRALYEMWSKGIPPGMLIRHLAPSLILPPDADDIMLWNMIVSMLEPPKRKKLKEYNTINDAVNLIKNSTKIMVLSGAGISTSAGLPDFRSRNGIYVQIHEEYPDLTDPKSMFEIGYFKSNPLPFYRFAKALYPGQFEPTIGHKFIKCIEEHQKLLRNYSQNIDTLEKQAGIKRVIECHGSFSKASCTNCNYCVDGDEIKDDIMNQRVPQCPKCLENKKNNDKVMNKDGEQQSEEEASDKFKIGDELAIMKPNIVFFGEQLGDEFHSSLDLDKNRVDLLIVIGSSLKVRPVALIPDSIPPEIPQILINKEPLEMFNFDIELLGNCDDIIQELCLRLGNDWSKICKQDTKSMTELDPYDILKPIESNKNNKQQQELSDIDNKNHREQFSEPTNLITGDDESLNVIDDNEEQCSFRSNQAVVPSESTEQNMIDDLEEIEEEEEDNNKLKNCDEDDDEDDWEDVEVMRSSNESLNSYTIEKATLNIPISSFVQIKPGKYLFHGAELTNAQYLSLTKKFFSSNKNINEFELNKPTSSSSN